MRRIVALLAAILVVASMVAPAAVLTTAPTAAQPGEDVPRGMVGLPSSNVNDAVPDYAQAAGAPTADDFRWSVMTSRHAESLSVDVTTRASLEGRESACLALQAPEWCESPEVAFVLEDTANHDGRTISVPKAPVVENLGRVPELAYVEHSSGKQYEVEVTDTGDQLAFHVEEFSTNEVTFSGEVSLQGSPAVDGAQYSYNLSNASSADNFSIDVTGSTASQWSNESAAGFLAGSSTSIDPGGNVDPTGPSANGKPVLEVTGHKETGSLAYSGGGSYFDFWGHSTNLIKSEQAIEGAPAVIDTIKADVQTTGADYDASKVSIDVYIQEGKPDGTYGNGQLVVSGYSPSAGTGTKTIDGFTYEPTSDTVTIEFVTTASSTGLGNYGHARQTDGGGSYSYTTLDSSSTGTASVAHNQRVSGSPSNISADDDDGSASASLGDFSDGQTKTVEFALSESATAINWGGAGKLDYQLKLEERTQTVDPAVEVNGHTTSYTGTLSDGQTASLSTDTAWLVDGENPVNISVSTAADGPAGEAGLDYRHSAEDTQTTDYSGETWTERYDITRTYSESRDNAAVTIPFASDRVVAVRDAEYRVNGGSWQRVGEADRSFDGSELTLQLASVNAGDEVQVRANASKVRVYNGEISVLQPTVEGDKLQTEVELSSWASDSYIDVSGTHPDAYLHHAENESWQSPSEYSVIRSDGGQEVHFPGASSGATARVVTMPMAVSTTGDVRIGVKRAGFNPEFDVRPAGSSGDSVTWSWEHPDLATGTTYVLYSNTSKVMVDSDEAQSPVTFESGDGDETLWIFADTGSSSSTDGGGGMWQDASGAVRDYAPIVPPEIVMVVGLLLFAVGAAYSERRSPDQTVYKRPFFITGALTGLAVVVIFLAPRVVFNPLELMLQATLPLLGLGAVGFAGLIAYGWYKARQKEAQPPTIEVMGRKK